MKNVFCVLFVTLFFAQGYCQKAYKLKAEPGEALKNELIKHVDSMFWFTPGINYNLTTKHICAYKDIDKDEMLEPDYLKNQFKKLEKAPNDAFVYNNIALYYQRNGDTLLAKEYYTKALANHKMLPKAKDSASFYSYRGVIKHNLKQNGVGDLEKALSINKADSTAIVFYPLLLIGEGKFDKVKTILTAALQAKKDNYGAYLMLIISDFYRTSLSIGADAEGGFQKIKDKDIEKIIDLDVYDSYINKNDKIFSQMKEMGKVFNVFIKFSPGIYESWQPSKKDIDFVEAREKYFKKLLTEKNANVYAVYMTLGTLSFVQKKFTEAQGYYNKALLAFPKDKESYDFNLSECYDNLAAAYYMDKKIDKTLETITAELGVKSIDKGKRKELLLNQARLTAQMRNLEKAIDITQEAKEIGEDFDVDFLLSYLYAGSDSGSLAQRYLEKAQQRVTMEKESCDMITYMAVFYISNGYLDEARLLFDQNKNNFVNYKCEDCEKILVKYLIPNN